MWEAAFVRCLRTERLFPEGYCKSVQGDTLQRLADHNGKSTGLRRIVDGTDTRELHASGGRDSRYQYELTAQGAPLGEPGTQIFIAKAPGFPLGSDHKVLIVRRSKTNTVFGATITENGPTLDGFEMELDDQPGDPALKLEIHGAGQMRLPFYP